MAKTVTFPVEASHILMFARSIGDTNPVYAGAEAGGVIAPPTFGQAVAQFDPEYHLRPKPDEPWFGSGKTPSGVDTPRSLGGLHAEQHFEYLRPFARATYSPRSTATVKRGRSRASVLAA